MAATYCPIRTFNENNDFMEIQACNSFLEKMVEDFSDPTLTWHSCRLKDAIERNSLVAPSSRKVILLYLHKNNDVFSKTFLKCMKKPEISTILARSFFLLPWDIDELEYVNALVQAVFENKLSDIFGDHIIKSDRATAIGIMSMENILQIKFSLSGNISDRSILNTLRQTEAALLKENEEEIGLYNLAVEKGNENDVGSTKFHQLMAELLGDRNYDSFDFNEHCFLKKKIGYALFGPPIKESGYDEKQTKSIESLYIKITENSCDIAQFKDRIEIAFIYNCTEPLLEEKLSRAKKYPDYNPNTDINPLPIFVLRKCRQSDNPCRIFIDDSGRVYSSWEGFIENNKLPKCKMVLPLNGSYSFDENGSVLLQSKLSPACDIKAKILRGTDIISAGTGLISGGILAASIIPAVTVAPVAITVGLGMGIGVGIYSIGRSIHSIVDRKRHKETLSFANSECRGAYLNIVAGSLGFAGAGATMIVSQLAAKGVTIGKAAGAIVNTINIVNIGASGVNLANSGFDVFDQWWNENETPSLLTIVQFSSSVLFFGNAVYNFKTVSTIVDEVQTTTISDLKKSLRSNRHRKTFNKMLKETIRRNNGNVTKGNAEVISSVRKIQSKDDVFAALTRSNKKFNAKGIKFSAENGEIKLNGVRVDMNEFSNMNHAQVENFITVLPENPEAPFTPTAESVSIRNLIVENFRNITYDDCVSLVISASNMLLMFDDGVKTLILNALNELLSKLHLNITNWLRTMYPNHEFYMRLMQMLIDFLRKPADDLEKQYQLWLQTNDPLYYNKIFEFIDIDNIQRFLRFFEIGINMYYTGTRLTVVAFDKLLSYFNAWFTQDCAEYEQRQEQTTARMIHSARRPTKQIHCDSCTGHRYVPK